MYPLLRVEIPEIKREQARNTDETEPSSALTETPLSCGNASQDVHIVHHPYTRTSSSLDTSVLLTFLFSLAGISLTDAEGSAAGVTAFAF